MGQRRLILRHPDRKATTFKGQASAGRLTHHYQAYKGGGLIKLACYKRVSNFNLTCKSLFIYVRTATGGSWRRSD